MSEQRGVKWTVCHVSGYTIACDPGCNTITPYPKTYKREELKKGTNITAHCEYLPKIVVGAIGEDFIELRCGPQKTVLYTGGYYESPPQLRLLRSQRTLRVASLHKGSS